MSPKVPLLFGRKRTSRVMGDREIFQEEGVKLPKYDLSVLFTSSVEERSH